MGSTSSPPDFYGYLIKADKSPSGIFEQLLLGIANYINRHVAPWDIDSLTPTKLAAFYRLVGGDYDPLFLETPHPSLSFIYQSLGCFHTLQQDLSPYTVPSVPALTPRGFVRWQTVQILLEPEEHVPFLQKAVKRFDIINPADGLPFPHPLPKEALPCRPDPEMVQWHEGVGTRLRSESHAIDTRGMPAAKHAEIGDHSSVNDHSNIGTARYSTHPPQPPSFRPPPSINLSHAIDAPSGINPRIPPPWDLERRRSSTSDIHSATRSPWHHENPTATAFPIHDDLHLRHPRCRSPSTISTSSVSSSSSSITASSSSVSPRLTSSNRHRHVHQHHPSELQRSRRHERRHSAHVAYSPRAAPHHRDAPVHPPPNSYFPPQQPARPPGLNGRGLNVRWGDMKDVANAGRPPLSNQGIRPVPTDVDPKMDSDPLNGRTRRARSGSEGKSASPLSGNGGRRYAAEGVNRN